jgi:alpha-D-xyloside xylohydrolase
MRAMKFSHGIWRMRDGVTPYWVARVARHYVERGELVLRCVHKAEPKNNLNNYGFTVRVSSPLPGVVRVRTSHLTGRATKLPTFDVVTDRTEGISVSEDADSITFDAGAGVTLRIGRRPFTLTLLDGAKKLTSTREGSGVGVMEVAGDRDYVLQRLSLGVGAHVYGAGERFGPLVRDGQTVNIWNEDPGTETDQAYKNISFLLTNQGFGLFVRDPGRVDFEVMTERVSAIQTSVPGSELDCYFVAGHTPKQILERYTALTGRPPLPPLWSFGLWLSTSFLTDYDEKIVGGLIDGMFERKIPLSVFHFDCLWMKEHHWCDFEWDEAKFPDPKAMLARLKQRDVKICLWINSYVSEFSKLFDEGRNHGYFLKDKNGDVYQRNDWQPQIALVDFTNPDATRWYQGKLAQLMEQGVDCFKTDFGERIPPDAVHHDGSDPEKMHNYYPYLYNQAVFSLLEEERGKGEAIVFARSATAGCQKFPVHWGGDCDARFEAMAETLRGGLSFGLSGGAFWSHDISGFNMTAPPALYKRWVAFGLLSSHSRLHGATSYRVPWAFDEESVDVLRFFTNLKLKLMPYVWACAVEAHDRGTPLLRAMMLEFPGDLAAQVLDTQYLFGPSLLVAPVFDEGNTVQYYLPPGEWTDYFTGERVAGGRFIAEKDVSFFRVPLFVRENTLLAVGARDDRPDYDFLDGLTLELFALQDGAQASAVVHAATGAERARFTATRTGTMVELRGTGGKDLRVRLRQPSVGKPSEGGTLVESGKDGTVLAWPDPQKPLKLLLD